MENSVENFLEARRIKCERVLLQHFSVVWLKAQLEQLEGGSCTLSGRLLRKLNRRNLSENGWNMSTSASRTEFWSNILHAVPEKRLNRQSFRYVDPPVHF